MLTLRQSAREKGLPCCKTAHVFYVAMYNVVMCNVQHARYLGEGSHVRMHADNHQPAREEECLPAADNRGDDALL